MTPTDGLVGVGDGDDGGYDRYRTAPRPGSQGPRGPPQPESDPNEDVNDDEDPGRAPKPLLLLAATLG